MRNRAGGEAEGDLRVTKPGTEEPHILVVEDEVGVLEIITINLEQAGYRVVPVADGMEALRDFERSRPALVILDLYLPSLSGFRLAQLFKRDAPSVPILVLTALDFAEAEDLASLGIEGFFTKPFDPGRLLRMVDYLIRAKPA